MGTQTQTFRSAAASSSDIEITNKLLDDKDTEYSHLLSNSLKQIIIKSRTTRADLKIAFVSTESGTKYITIWSGSQFSIADLNFSGKTLYVQSSKDATVVEIVELF